MIDQSFEIKSLQVKNQAAEITTIRSITATISQRFWKNLSHQVECVAKQTSHINQLEDFNMSRETITKRFITAIENGENETVQSLLKNSLLDVNGKNDAGQSCLHLAIQKKDLPLTQQLLQLNPDITVVAAKQTPIQAATALDISQNTNGSWDYTELLLQHPSIPTDKEDKAQLGSTLIDAILYRKFDLAKRLLTKTNASIGWTSHSKTLLHILVGYFADITNPLKKSSEKDDSVDIKKEESNNSNKSKNEPKREMMEIKELINILIQKKADITAKSTADQLTPFDLANDQTMLALFLENKAVTSNAAIQPWLKEQLNLKLLNAVSDNNYDLVKYLLDYGADANAQENTGEKLSCLHWAFQRNNAKMIQLLLQKKANPIIKNAYNQTPLTYAINNINPINRDCITTFIANLPAEKGNPYGAEFSGDFADLISRKEFVLAELLFNKVPSLDVNARTTNQNTPLHLLISYWQETLKPQPNNQPEDSGKKEKKQEGGSELQQIKSLINLVLQRKVDFNATNKSNQRAFDLAESSDTISAFLNDKNFMNAAKDWILDNFSKRLLKAVSDDNYDLAAFLISKKANPNARQTGGRWLTCLHIAVEKKNARMIELLLRNKADPTIQSGTGYMGQDKARTPIQDAVTMNPIPWECVDAFAKNYTSTPDDAAQFGNAFIQAVKHKKYNTALLLLKANAAIDWQIDQNTPLHFLTMYLEEALTSQPADIDPTAKPESKKQPSDNNEEINQIKELMHILMQRTKSFNQNKDRKSAFDLAQSIPVLTIFLDAENFQTIIRFGLKDELSQRLRSAVSNGNHVFAKFLIDRGADVNSKHRYGRELTCLHIAVEKQDSEMIKLLLQHKADPELLSGEPDVNHRRTAIQDTLFINPIPWDCIKAFAENYKCSAGDLAKFGNCLLTAIMQKKYDIALSLLNANASVNWHNNKNTLLHFLILQLEQALTPPKPTIEAKEPEKEPGSLEQPQRAPDTIITSQSTSATAPTSTATQTTEQSTSPSVSTITTEVHEHSSPAENTSGTAVNNTDKTKTPSSEKAASKNASEEISKIMQLFGILIERGIDTSATNNDRRRAFDLAVNISSIYLFLDNKKFKEASQSWLKDALSLRLVVAVAEENLSLVRFLIAHNADVNAKEVGGRALTCLHIALQKNNPKMIELLLKHGANPESLSCKANAIPERTCMDDAYFMDPTPWECVEIFAKNHQCAEKDPAHFGVILLKAIMHKRYDTALLFLKANASITYTMPPDNLPHLHRLIPDLEQAYKDNNQEHIEKITWLIYFLLNAGAKIDAVIKGKSALDLATNIEIINLLTAPDRKSYMLGFLTKKATALGAQLSQNSPAELKQQEVAEKTKDDSTAKSASPAVSPNDTTHESLNNIHAAIYMMHLALFCQDYPTKFAKGSTNDITALISTLQSAVATYRLESRITSKEVQPAREAISQFAAKNNKEKSKKPIMDLIKQHALWSDKPAASGSKAGKTQSSSSSTSSSSLTKSAP